MYKSKYRSYPELSSTLVLVMNLHPVGIVNYIEIAPALYLQGGIQTQGDSIAVGCRCRDTIDFKL